MDEIERYQHQMHAKTSGFQHKVDRAYEITREAFAIGEKPFYCAFSGGVDSTVVLHILMQYPWQVPVLWGDDGYDYPETLDFLRETEARYGFCLRRIRCLDPWHDWCDEMSQPEYVDNPDMAWGNPPNWYATWQSLKDASQHGYSGVFLGLLASESRSRSYALRDGYKPLYQVKSEHGMWHCSPLANWTKADIWGYIISRGLPYNPVYDKLAELGLSLERRRVAPLTCFRTVQYGPVVVLKSGWPELYNKLCVTFPRVREYS